MSNFFDYLMVACTLAIIIFWPGGLRYTWRVMQKDIQESIFRGEFLWKECKEDEDPRVEIYHESLRKGIEATSEEKERESILPPPFYPN